MEVTPGLIPDGWETKTLGDICGRITTGKLDANAMVADGDYPFFTCASENYWIDKYAFDCEALLVSGNGANVGYVHYYNGKFNAYQRTYVISEFFADVQFIKLFLDRNLQERIRTEVNAGNTPYIRMDTLAEMRVILPRSRAEQEAIAEALGDVDALVGALDSALSKKRDLKQAAMQQLLTGQTRLPGFHGEWEVKRLGDVAEINMGQSPKSSNYNTKGNGLPLIQGNADIENRKTIARIFTTEITKKCTADDLIMSVRAPVGQISKAMFDACLGRGVCTIRYPNDYLYHYLINQEANWANLSKGSTFDSVNSADVKAFKIHLPADQKEQIAISAVLSEMDAEITALEARRDKTRALKQGMMQELLTGRTRLG